MPYKSIIIDAEKVIEKTHLGVGNYAADLGTGREARFALAAAKIVGQEGKVYAADIVKSILPAVKSKAAMYGLNNLETVWTDLEIHGAAKAIGDGTLDVAFLVTVLFQSEKHEAIIKEALRMLKSGGRLAIVDWKKMDTPFGPAAEQRVDPEAIKRICAKLELEFVEEVEAGEYHFGLIFKKPV